MLKLHKSYIIDENQEKIAVQIPIAEFEALEEAFENYGLSKLIDETIDDKSFTKDDALKYYEDLKKNVEG